MQEFVRIHVNAVETQSNGAIKLIIGKGIHFKLRPTHLQWTIKYFPFADFSIFPHYYLTRNPERHDRQYLHAIAFIACRISAVPANKLKSNLLQDAGFCFRSLILSAKQFPLYQLKKLIFSSASMAVFYKIMHICF